MASNPREVDSSLHRGVTKKYVRRFVCEASLYEDVGVSSDLIVFRRARKIAQSDY